MTKNKIIKNASKDLGIESMDISYIFDVIIKEIKTSLEKGEDVNIYGLGTFRIKQKKPAKRFNLQKGIVSVIPARKKVIFDCSTIILDNLNNEKGL